MANLDFEDNLALVRRLSPHFSGNRLERRDHAYMLGIGLSSRCNFNCPMCYYHRGEECAQDMPLGLLEKIMGDMPRLASIIIGLEGEPFLHPRIFDALDILASRADGLTLVSNGSMLTGEICGHLARYPVREFALSIDAGSPEAYAKFRRGGNLAAFMANGTRLVERMGAAVRLHATVFAENLPFLDSIPKVAAQMGIHDISLQMMRTHAAATLRGATIPTQAMLARGLEKIIAAAQKNGIVLLLDHYLGAALQHCAKAGDFAAVASTPAARTCEYIHSYASVLSDGRLFPCCGDLRPEPIGEYSFDGIFNHEYLQRLRFIHAAGAPLPQPCRLCLATP